MSVLWNQFPARRAIKAMIRAGYKAHVAIFRVARFDYTSYRYGAAIGNQILLVCGQHATSDISPALPVFRWKRPILPALIVSRESPATTSARRYAPSIFPNAVPHRILRRSA